MTTRLSDHLTARLLDYLLLALLTLAVSAFFIRSQLAVTGGVLGAPLDDAWIHFQFARNLSQGNGFSFNPGEATPGSTAPLWTMLLAGVGLFTEDFLAPAICLSGAFLLVSVWLSYGFTVDLNGQPPGRFPGRSGVGALRSFYLGRPGRHGDDRLCRAQPGRSVALYAPGADGLVGAAVWPGQPGAA
ncbi:MAG: hypothetical protein M5U34_14955 [Chloroflexi bacterium]|nr:hypothetical protein [Chloroflexota bacterium]